jgi:hypothetical protein
LKTEKPGAGETLLLRRSTEKGRDWSIHERDLDIRKPQTMSHSI